MKRKLAEILNVIFGFRKFLLMLLIFLVGIIFRVKAFISGGEFVDLMKSTTIAFFSANGVEHIMNTVTAYVNSKNAPAPAGEPVADTDEKNDNEEVEEKIEG